MSKKECLQNVLSDMEIYLDKEQLRKLDEVLFNHLYKYDITEKKTGLSLKSDDTEKYLKLFVATLRLERLSEKTIEQYVMHTNKFFHFIKKNFRDVTSDDIKFYLSWYISYHKISPVTLNNMQKYIHPFFKWLYNNEYTINNPMKSIKPIKYNKKEVNILSDEDIEKLRDTSKDIKTLTIVDFLLATGVRVSELYNLNISDVNFASSECKIYGEKTNRWRTVYLDSKAKKHLFEYLSSRSDDNPAFFISSRKPYKRLSRQSIEKILIDLGNNAGINQKVTVHIFRKTLASILCRRGMDLIKISELLGHADTRTTSKFYISISKDEIKNDYNKYI